MSILGNIFLQTVPVTTQSVNGDSSTVETVDSVGQNASVVPNNTVGIEELQNTVQTLKEQVETQQTILWVLIGLFVLYIIYTFISSRRNQQVQQTTDETQDDRLAKLERRLELKINNANSALEQKMKGMVDDVKEQATIKAQSTPHQAQGYSAFIRDVSGSHGRMSQEQKHEIPYSSVPKNNIKYFTPQESGGQLSVKERNLKDDGSRSWFVMDINGDAATYDINKQVTEDILADQSVLRICANEFEPNASARDIKTIKKGTLRKEGQSWIVTQKITIELV